MSEYDPNDPNSVPPAEGQGDGGAEGGGEEFDPNFVGDGPKARNNGFLVLVALVALGGAGVYLMKMRAVPQSAQASAEIKKANDTINKFLSDSGGNMNSMKEMLKKTEKDVAAFLNYQNIPQVKLDQLKNNPFQIEAPKEGDPNREKTEDARRRAEEKRKVLEDAQKLKLQSVLANVRVPTCMINGKTYTIGNEIEFGFTIESMEPGSVMIKRGDYKLALSMSSGNLGN